MNLNKYLFLTLGTLAFVGSTIGTTLTSELYHESRLVESAPTIVEGYVSKGYEIEANDGPSCFSSVYELTVTKSLKGEHSRGEKLVVGMNLQTSKIELGQRQLLFLYKSPENFFDYCSNEIKDDTIVNSEIRILNSATISAFELSDANKIATSLVNGSDRFVAFSENKELILNDSDLDNANCRRYMFDYGKLRERIMSLLEIE